MPKRFPPPEVRTAASMMLETAKSALQLCVRPDLVYGWWVQAHTEACVGQYGYTLAQVHEIYQNDEASTTIGNPADGVFVSMTPRENIPQLAEEGPELGQVREKFRVPLEQGERVAEKVEAAVGPYAEAMVLVGSIRRRRLEIADVEFVVLPKDLEEFPKEMRRIGFTAGGKGRKYTGIMDGIKVELYVAFKPEEMGGLVLTYTGDYLSNVSMRAQAKRMGLKLDQYGVWKGNKIVFQSPDEKEFFDYLGREWRDPEQRSLTRRADLTDMAKKLQADEHLSAADRKFAKDMILKIKVAKYLPPEEETVLEDLFLRRFPKETAKAETVEKPVMKGAFLGAEELIEMGDPEAAIEMGAEELIEMGQVEALKTLKQRWLDGEVQVVAEFRPGHSLVAIVDLSSKLFLVEWFDEDVRALFERGVFFDDSVMNSPATLGNKFKESVVHHAEQLGVPPYAVQP